VFSSGPGGNIPDWELYILEIVTGTVTRLTENTVRDSSPDWHPNQPLILYVSDGEGGTAIYQVRATGEEGKRLYDGEGRESHPQYSPDGEQILFSSNVGDLDQLYLMSYDGLGVRALGQQHAASAIWFP